MMKSLVLLCFSYLFFYSNNELTNTFFGNEQLSFPIVSVRNILKQKVQEILSTYLHISKDSNVTHLLKRGMY